MRPSSSSWAGLKADVCGLVHLSKTAGQPNNPGVTDLGLQSTCMQRLAFHFPSSFVRQPNSRNLIDLRLQQTCMHHMTCDFSSSFVRHPSRQSLFDLSLRITRVQHMICDFSSSFVWVTSIAYASLVGLQSSCNMAPHVPELYQL